MKPNPNSNPNNPNQRKPSSPALDAQVYNEKKGFSKPPNSQINPKSRFNIRVLETPPLVLPFYPNQINMQKVHRYCVFWGENVENKAEERKDSKKALKMRRQ